MPEADDRLTRARSLFKAALSGDAAASTWEPPSAEALGPLFPAYEIQALLGRGGMGAVYRARQKSLDRLVALKLLPFDLGVREDFAKRFRREATALARLSHPHIVAVHDFGQADDGHFFMVMEYVEGADLAARLHDGPLPPAEALAIVRQVCDALEFAHAQGVVHRDIKPGNILLDAAGRVKVTDFGIAQLAGDEPRTALTATGALLGTPEYVAPEQMLPAATVDHRADIFSLGVMLYELLTGQLPRGVFRPISQFVPSARSLDRVVTRALQSEPAARYATVAAMRRELIDPKRAKHRAMIRFLSIASVVTPLAVVGLALLGWLSRKPATVPQPFVNSLGQRFVPAGTPGVLFCTTETRVQDFAAFALATELRPSGTIVVNYIGGDKDWQSVSGNWREPGFPQADDHPVVGVTYPEATAFCQWLTEHERTSKRIGSEERYRLPTNAEWSAAVGLSPEARFPSGHFPWGETFPPTGKVGNYASAETHESAPRYEKLPVLAGNRDGHAFTAPVGTYAPNPHGLYDLGGNAWEWTEGGDESTRTLRGGSWWEASTAKLDAARQVGHPPGTRCNVFGFRIVLERKNAAPAEQR